MAVALLPRHSLDVHDVFEAVDGGDFALAAFVGAALDDHFVVFTDRDGADLWVIVRCYGGVGQAVVEREDLRCAFL